MSRKRKLFAAIAGIVPAIIAICLLVCGCSKAPMTAPEIPDTPPDTTVVKQDSTVTFEPTGPYTIEPDGSVLVTASVKISGIYRIFANVVYTALVNESFFLEIQGSDGIVRNDQYPNAGSSRVVLDDPALSGSTTKMTTEVVAGIFWMPKGLAKIKIRHFSQIATKYPLLVQGSGFNTVNVLTLRCEYLGQ